MTFSMNTILQGFSRAALNVFGIYFKLQSFVFMPVFGLNSGAYVSEIMRSGIQAVDPGQLEAARALGLGYPISMLKVVIPQAVKNILHTMGNEIITLVKDTSLARVISVYESIWEGQAFIKSEARYTRLMREFPDRAEALFQKSEKVALDRYAHLLKLKDLYAPDAE